MRTEEPDAREPSQLSKVVVESNGHGPGLDLKLPHGVCKMLRSLLKGVPRTHDMTGFHGSWLPGICPGSCVIGVQVGPC
jgi:hypothetical protein